MDMCSAFSPKGDGDQHLKLLILHEKRVDGSYLRYHLEKNLIDDEYHHFSSLSRKYSRLHFRAQSCEKLACKKGLSKLKSPQVQPAACVSAASTVKKRRYS